LAAGVCCLSQLQSPGQICDRHNRPDIRIRPTPKPELTHACSTWSMLGPRCRPPPPPPLEGENQWEGVQGVIHYRRAKKPFATCASGSCTLQGYDTERGIWTRQGARRCTPAQQTAPAAALLTAAKRRQFLLRFRPQLQACEAVKQQAHGTHKAAANPPPPC
jgi:hypothetical protein